MKKTVGRPARNELAKMQKHNSTWNKKHKHSYFTLNPNAGDVEHNVAMFNHMNNVTFSADSSSVDASTESASGEGMGESLITESGPGKIDFIIKKLFKLKGVKNAIVYLDSKNEVVGIDDSLNAYSFTDNNFKKLMQKAFKTVDTDRRVQSFFVMREGKLDSNSDDLRAKYVKDDADSKDRVKEEDRQKYKLLQVDRGSRNNKDITDSQGDTFQSIFQNESQLEKLLKSLISKTSKVTAYLIQQNKKTLFDSASPESNQWGFEFANTNQNTATQSSSPTDAAASNSSANAPASAVIPTDAAASNDSSNDLNKTAISNKNVKVNRNKKIRKFLGNPKMSAADIDKLAALFKEKLHESSENSDQHRKQLLNTNSSEFLRSLKDYITKIDNPEELSKIVDLMASTFPNVKCDANKIEDWFNSVTTDTLNRIVEDDMAFLAADSIAQLLNSLNVHTLCSNQSVAQDLIEIVVDTLSTSQQLDLVKKYLTICDPDVLDKLYADLVSANIINNADDVESE